MMAIRGLLIASAMMMSGAAFAQSLTDVSGNVLVNRGSGYVKSGSASGLATGDAVMARPGSSAVLRYADGCQVKVLPGKVTKVSGVSPCSFVAADLPASGQRNDPPPAIVASESESFGGGIAPILIGGIVVIGGAAAIIAISRNQRSSP